VFFQLKWCVTLRGTSAPQQIGRYEILEELGRGAMGVVFKARDPFIGRLVAVKTITTGIADNPDLLERFRREAQAAGGLQHPNIVTIYEMSEFDGTPFIAMEYLEGESLERTIGGQLRLPLVHKLGYLVQACRALDYAHRRDRQNSRQSGGAEWEASVVGQSEISEEKRSRRCKLSVC
jgi:serine/threonine protein kinase